MTKYLWVIIIAIVMVGMAGLNHFGVVVQPEIFAATATPAASVAPTASPTWVSYIPTAEQVTLIPAIEESAMHVDITFPNAGFRVADPGQVAVAAGINPDGTTYLSNITRGTWIEQYTGYSAQVITTLRITYQIHYGDTTYFAFQVFNRTVKDITIKKQILPVTPSPIPTVTVTPSPTPTPIPGGIRVQMYNSNRSATTNSIYVFYRLFNTGTGSVNLCNVKLRYYYTIDGEMPQSCWCDYSTVGSGNITGTFVKVNTPKTNADYFLETGFTSGAGSLDPGAGIDIQIRFAKNDWSNYSQTNDYSFNATATSYVDWTKVTGYCSGSLWWGVEP